jgi:ubiquinone/menaquinone biosynthesis C-methylase UbiE
MNYAPHNYAQSELAYKEFLKPSLRQAIDLLDVQDNFRILDAGCGPGAMFAHFAEKLKPGGQIVGIDASDSHLEIAKQTIQQYQLQKLVLLEKGDLLKDLPFENDYFDIIWLSDVLFPDDFGNEIFSILEKLYKKLKPNGKIAIFYSNWLRLTLLPGHSILEHNISIANEKRKSSGFSWTAETHPENALAWLNECSFINCENHYVSSFYQSPLEDHIKNYIYYHLTEIYKKAVEFKSTDFEIPEDQIDEFYKITDVDSADYILNKPFYHCAVHGQFTIGQKKISR